MKELNQWRNEQVYDKIDDLGQQCISLIWVMKEKVVIEKKIIKACLCAWGFEEEQNFRTDSPICSRKRIRLSCFIISSNWWSLNSLDVKTAFLQGKTIERTVFVHPPKEANTNKIWKSWKCIYGLADASQYWYLKFREELIKLGANLCQLGQGVFIWSINSKPVGIMVCFVNNLLWEGNRDFIYIINKLKQTFHIGAEHSQAFNYIGIHLKQNDDFSTTINQFDYINSINEIKVNNTLKINKNDKLT